MRTSGWRRIATGVWGWPTDPQIYGRLELDAEPILNAVELIRERTGTKVTVTHLVVRALARALRETPEINTRLRFGRFVPRGSVDVFHIVSTRASADLSGIKVRHADAKDIIAVAREVDAAANGTRAGEASDIERTKHLMDVLPLPVLKILLRAAAFLTVDLGLDLKRFGLPREAFGGAMVSSVGMFGIPEGWAPLSPLYRVPLLVLVGKVRPTPWVEANSVTVRPVLPVMVTIDHRWVDGHQIARLSETFRAYLADPLAFEPADITASRAGGRRLREIT